MKVYIVASFKYCEIKGVFYSLTAAEKYIKIHDIGDYCTIEEQEVLK